MNDRECKIVLSRHGGLRCNHALNRVHCGVRQKSAISFWAFSHVPQRSGYLKR